MEKKRDLYEKPCPLGLDSAGQMLAKAKAEFALMERKLSDWTMSNFFVTAWQIKDFLPAIEGKSKKAVEKELLEDRDLKVCRHLATQSKHKTVEQHPLRDEVDVNNGAVPGMMILGQSALGTVPRKVRLIEGEELRPIDVGFRVIKKWEEFFIKYNIPFD